MLSRAACAPVLTSSLPITAPPLGAGQLLELSADVLPRNAAALPVIDCVLLGVGPDGHVASLFPNRKETAATGAHALPPCWLAGAP